LPHPPPSSVKLNYDGQETISLDGRDGTAATLAEVKSALESLSNIGAGNVVVHNGNVGTFAQTSVVDGNSNTWPPQPPVLEYAKGDLYYGVAIEFTGALAATPQAARITSDYLYQKRRTRQTGHSGTQHADWGTAGVGQIAEFDGVSWVGTTPTTEDVVHVSTEGRDYEYSALKGGTWTGAAIVTTAPMVDAGIKWAGDTLKAMTGEPVVIRRSGQVDVQTIMSHGNATHNITDVQGLTFESAAHDWLCMAGDYAFGGAAVLPEHSDEIRHIDGTATNVYKVLPTNGRDEVYSSTGGRERLLRIHTKLIDVV
jgi:hypothetical protein